MKSLKRQGISGVVLTIILIIILIILGIYTLMRQSGEKGKVDIVDVNSSPTVATSTEPMSEESVPQGWKTYSNQSFGYELRHPETITFTNELDITSPVDGRPQRFPANTQIIIKMEDISEDIKGSQIAIVPLYSTSSVIPKPIGYTTLKRYVDQYVAQTIKDGERSAAGVNAKSSAVTLGGLNGYLVVTSDGSVRQNRTDTYFLERGNFVYSFDISYSGFDYQNKNADEVQRVDTARKILSSIKFTK
jgi:hypothetical protein